MASQYYPQAVPVVENMMRNNPYAMRAFGGQTGGSLGQAGQMGKMGGNPNMLASMIGAPGATAYGTGMYPTKSDGTADISQGGGLNMSPVATSMTMGGGKPPETTVKNPAAEQTMAAAGSSGELIGKASEAANQSKLSAAEAAGTEMGKEGIQRDSAYDTIGAVVGNAMSDFKSSAIQQAGTGPIPGMVGSLATKAGLPNTGNISAMKGNQLETASAIARTISPTSNGITRLIGQYLEAVPSNASTDEQAFTNYGTLYRTGVSLKIAYDNLRQDYSDKQLDSLKPDDLSNLLSKQLAIVNKQQGAQIDDYFGKMIQNTPARATFNSTGRIPTQANDWSAAAAKMANGRFGFSPLGQVQPPKNPNAPQTNLPKGVPNNVPKGASHYSPSTGKFYDNQGNVING